MAIVPGRRLGPYEILSAIGAGGMGKLDRARSISGGRTPRLIEPTPFLLGPL